ncbi:MAG: threonine/serine exporter family protein [Holdemanella sp.]|nr:threonine/serine exporter family protein [Holdemanella sp.]
MVIVAIKAFISSFLASLGFGVIDNIHGKKLLGAGFAGACGGIIYKVCLYYGYGEYISNFLGAVALSICAEIMARKMKTPVTTFIACALIPLVPGGGLFRMMSQAMKGETNTALNTLVETLCIASVLAIGILVVSSIFKRIASIRK